MLLATAALLYSVCVCGQAAASEVRVEFTGSTVSVTAKDATVSDILAEYARVGRVAIVNGDAVDAGRVTLTIEAAAESSVLDVLLRTVAGYMGMPRPFPLANESQFDRILVMPRSNPVAPSPQAAATIDEPPPVTATIAPPPNEPLVRARVNTDGTPVADDQVDAAPRAVAKAPPKPPRPR